MKVLLNNCRYKQKPCNQRKFFIWFNILKVDSDLFKELFFVIIVEGQIFAFNRPDNQTISHLHKIFEKYVFNRKYLTCGDISTPKFHFSVGQITMDKENFAVDLEKFRLYHFKVDR